MQIAPFHIISLTITMATRPISKLANCACGQCRQRKSVRHTNCIKPIRIDIRRSETTLSPSDELECRQIYEKLEQLQPNGVCVNLNTLRRALYPPIAISKNKNEQILLLKTYNRPRTYEIPQIRTYDIPKQTKIDRIDCMNLDQIINRVNKHAAINYSYYTRTK